MRENCQKCTHKPVCDLWAEAEGMDAFNYCNNSGSECLFFTHAGWINVKERLPEHGQRVRIWVDGEEHTANFERGISETDRTKMRIGKMEDPEEVVGGDHFVKRSKLYKPSDELGNNRVPYRWRGDGPMAWFGQCVTHWMPTAEKPKEGRGMGKLNELNLVQYLNDGLRELPEFKKAAQFFQIGEDKLRKYRHFAFHAKKARTRKKYQKLMQQIDPGYRMLSYFEETGTKWWLRRPENNEWRPMTPVSSYFRFGYPRSTPVDPFLRASFELPKTTCNCWQCQAERMYGAKRTTPMRGLEIGKVYLYQLYNETVEEFEAVAEANLFRAYADANIPYWDYDPVSTIDLNDPKQIEKYRARGWIKEEKHQ